MDLWFNDHRQGLPLPVCCALAWSTGLGYHPDRIVVLLPEKKEKNKEEEEEKEEEEGKEEEKEEEEEKKKTTEKRRRGRERITCFSQVTKSDHLRQSWQ